MLAETWKKLSFLGTDAMESATLRNRVVITNQLATINTLVLFGSVILFFVIGQQWLGGLLVPITVLNAFVLLLHARKLYTIGRVLYCVNLTLMVYFYSSLTGDYTGIFLYFYSLSLYPIVLFESREWRISVSLLAFILGLYVAYHLRIRPFAGLLALPMDKVRIVGIVCIYGSLAYVVLLMWLHKNHVTLLMERLLQNEKARNQKLQEQDLMIMRQDSSLRRNQQELQEKTRQMQQTQQQMQAMLEELRRNQAALALQQYYDKGVAELAEVTRWTPESRLQPWAYQVLAFLVRYVNGTQGTLYIVHQTHDGNGGNSGNGAVNTVGGAKGNWGTEYLQLVAGYALAEGSGAPTRVGLGEGLLGELLRSPTATHLTQLDGNGSGHMPAQTHTLRTAAGEVALRELFLLPLLYNANLVGAIEVANLNNFTPAELFFLQRIGTRLGAALAGIYINEEIRMSN
jgi:hypothetical protein